MDHHRAGVSPANKISFKKIVEEFNSFGVLVLSEEKDYKKIDSPVLLRCPKCERSFKMSLFDIRHKQNKSCESCSRKASRKVVSLNQISTLLLSVNGKLINPPKEWTVKEVLSFQCNRCSSTYSRAWNLWEREAKKGRSNCKACGIKERNIAVRNKTKDRIIEIAKQSNTKIVEERGEDGKTGFECPNCSSIFYRAHKYLALPNRTNLCPKCSSGRPTSQQEERLIKELKKITTVIQGDRIILSPKEIDIYLPSFNIGIEINGLHYHSELAGKDKNYHINKTNLAKEKGIQLLHFWELEINNKFDLVLSMIKSKCNISSKLFARKLIKKDVPRIEAKEFFESNHIDGFINGKHIGLYDKEKLISCITIGKERYGKNNEMELLRFANEKDISVVGGFSKLTKGLSLVSFANKRISSGDVYIKNGWELIDHGKPSYWYFNSKKKLAHRSTFMKHKLKKLLGSFDPEKTEWENMVENGWDRVWDCGVIKFRKI